MPEAFIIEAVRTPIGRHNGVLRDVRPDDLAALVVREAVQRARIDPDLVDEVYLGCANQAGEDNRNVARMAALLAGFPVSVAGVTFNRLCSSGLAAINAAARAIKAGEGDVFVAGGVEGMTRAPFAIGKGLDGSMRQETAWDTTLGWRFPNPVLKERFGTESMGETAENLREIARGITREDQDRFSLESHRRAIAASESGRFSDEIVPVSIPQPKGEPVLVTRDEHPRPDTSLESLGRLRPVFREGGTVTAGNASQLSDGASALVIMTQQEADARGIKPLARIVDYATSGVRPEDVMEAPIPTVRRLLEKTGLAIDDFDLVEHNEAYASASLAVSKVLGIPREKLNVHGGAVALGHPIGCSGARIVTTLLHAMQDRGAERGLATLCLGGGNGMALVVERA